MSKVRRIVEEESARDFLRRHAAKKAAEHVEVDLDNAYSMSDLAGTNFVYFDVGGQGDKWFMSAVTDCPNMSEIMIEDDGPYRSRDTAVEAGMRAAYDWFSNNDLRSYPDGRLRMFMRRNRL